MERILFVLIGILIYTASVFYGGYSYSSNKHETAALKVEVKAEQAVVKKQEEVAQVTHKSEEKAVVVQEKIKIVYKTINKEVIKYVERTPDASSPISDPEWIKLFNISSLGCSPEDPSCVARAEADGEVSRAEALWIVKEQHELYHGCRNTLTELQDYYENLRKTINQKEESK
jgi:hypothetical protein